MPASTAIDSPNYAEDDLRIVKVISDNPFVKTAISQQPDEKMPIYVITLTLSPSAPPGRINGVLLIETTDTQHQTVKVPFDGIVLPNSRLIPEQLFLGVSKKGVELRSYTTISTVSQDRLRIEKIDNPLPYLSVDIKPKVEGKEYILTATLKPDAPAGNIKGEVVIHTNDSDQPVLKLPVYAYVEENG